MKVYASEPPKSVTVNGVAVDYEYLDAGLTFTVDIPVADCAAEKVVEITYASENPAIANGLVGLSRRMARSIEALKFRTGVDPIDDLAMMGTINEAILYSCEDAKALADLFMTNYQNLPSILAKQPRLKDEDIKWFLEHCGWNL